MVTRKTSLPYPSSPSQNQQPDSFAPAASDLVVDTSDVPPVPGSARDYRPQQQTNAHMDNDNPWQDQRSPPAQSLPDALRAGGAGASGHQREHSLTNIPQALRPGGSGQDTPRSSIDSGESRDWWDDDDAENAERSPRRSPVREVPESLRPRGHSPAAAPQPPSPSVIKRKPVPVTLTDHEDSAPHSEFASNNPFRRPSSDAPAPPVAAPPLPPSPHWGSEEQQPEGKGKAPMRDPAFSASITDFSRMSINGGSLPDPSAYHKMQTPQQEQDDPWKKLESPAPPQQEQEGPWQGFESPAPPQHAPPPPQAAPPPIPPPYVGLTNHPSSFAEPRDSQINLQNSWGPPRENAPVPPPVPSDPQKLEAPHNAGIPSYSQHQGAVSGVTEQIKPPSEMQTHIRMAEPSLLDDDDEDEFSTPSTHRPNPTGQPHQSEQYAPPPGPPPGRSLNSTTGIPSSEEAAPPKPPRPAIRTAPLSEAELAKNAEYRNETYQIKHFNWFDHVSGRLRRSSMLTQNKNGPCPLLALVNALILGAQDESQAALDDALRSREQVSLGLIIETLMYELVDRNSMVGQQLPDVDELNAFLMRLRTGMNANPRFIPPSAPAPNIMDARNSMLHVPGSEPPQARAGTFEATGDIKLYGAFSVPLVHGWIPESDAAQAFARSAPTYEDAQAIQFSEDELEYKLTREGLSPDEQRVWEDITSIKNFFKLHPTQLTPYGLRNIQQSLSSGSFAIMFRNDHFSTIYRHPQSGQIFTLITDAGYADRDEIIWESLVDISGKGNEFFSGDFMPVSHQQAGGSNSGPSQHLTVDQTDNAPLSPQQQQEQHDADFAMALQLQEEEEQRQRAEQARRRRSGQGAGNGAPSPRGSTGNIPITLHPTRSRQSQSDLPENRPAIPPRNQRPTVPAVNRPADASSDDAPPAYEEAAKVRPYIPPVGSPLHPSSGPTGEGASPMSSSSQLTGTISTAGGSNSAHPPGPNAPHYGSTGRPPHGRIPSNVSGRLSAYNEQASGTPQQQMPGAYWDGRRPAGGPTQGVPVGSSGRPGRQPGQERDCVVM